MLDTRTAVLLITAMSLLMAVIFFALRRSYPDSIHGLSTWGTALLLIVIGSVFATTKGILPLFFYTVLPNFLLCTGIYLLYAGTQLLHKQQPRYGRWMACICAFVAVTAWFTWVSPDYVMRLRVINVLMLLLFCSEAVFLAQQRPVNFPRGMALLVTLTLIGLQIYRFASTFMNDFSTSVLDNSMRQSIYISGFSFSILLFSVSAVLMAGEKLNEELRHLASHDSLTNALNRRHFHDIAKQELARSQRRGNDISLIAIDVDYFKRINDEYGHQCGDQVLLELVHLCQQQLRPGDLLARFGGEEFFILLPDTNLKDALSIAERLRSLCDANSSEPHYTISLGVSSCAANSLQELTPLLKAADQALYIAKEQGRNRVAALPPFFSGGSGALR